MKKYVVSKNTKRVTTFLISGSLLMGSVIPSFAQTKEAIEKNTPKDEVVYVKLNDSGDINNVYVVNSFDIRKGEKIVDYGDYTKTLNLSTNDKLNYEDGKINATINSEDNKFYYEGYTKTNQIPWNIKITYILNNNEISADELAGKSGKLEVKIDIKKNDKVDDVFFDNYALQISLGLDGEKCKNIKADGGTIASVGSKKNISFVKLAGNEASYTITSDVKDFEMDQISFNGLKMGMDVNIDSSKMTKSFDTLVSAVENLNNGSSKLKTNLNTYKKGASSLSKGANSLKSGIDNYKSGICSLDNGISTLSSGLYKYKKGVNTIHSSSEKLLAGSRKLSSGVNSFEGGINSLSEGANNLKNGVYNLSQGSSQYKQKLNAYANSVNKAVSVLKANLPEEELSKLNLDNMVSQAYSLAEGYENINSGIKNLKSGASSLDNGVQKLASKTNNLSEGANNLSNGIEKLSGGTATLLNNIDQIENAASNLKGGSSKLVNGIDKINNGVSTLQDSSNKLSNGAEKLASGASTLNQGTSKLNSKTSNLPKTIDSKIDEITSKYSNKDFKAVSFVSDKNKEINSVQFAIRTDSIKEPEKEKVEVKKEPEKNLFDRFFRFIY